MAGEPHDDDLAVGFSAGVAAVNPVLMVHGDPEYVMSVLDAVSEGMGRVAAAAFRSSAHLHREADAGARRHLLGLDAARYGDQELAARIAAVPVDGAIAEWGVQWATGTRLDPRLRRTLNLAGVHAIATATVEGRRCAVTGGTDGTVRVWDLATGRQRGEPMTGQAAWIFAIATIAVDGRPYAIIGDGDRAGVWDLTRGRLAGGPLTGHTDVIRAVAVTTLDGRPYVITGGDDGMARIWDMTTRRPSAVLRGHNDWIYTVAVTTLNGRRCAVTGGDDRTVRSWDLTTGQAIGRVRTDGEVWAVATTVLDGHPCAVIGSRDGSVLLWDLVTGRPAGPELTFPLPVQAVAATDGRLVVGFGPEVAVLNLRRT